jgi:hypothetical protein
MVVRMLYEVHPADLLQLKNLQPKRLPEPALPKILQLQTYPLRFCV